MENFEFIEYHRTRDFSQKMNVTFGFLRQNFGPLFKSILFIAGPPVLVVGLLAGTLFSDMIDLSTVMNPMAAPQYVTSPSFWLQIGLIFIFYMVASVVALATINCYIVLYGEKKSSQITVNEVWDRVRQTFFMYLGTAIMLGILLIVAYFIIAVFIIAMGAASPALAVLGGFILIPAFFYLIVSLSLTFIVRSYEPVGVFEAFMRSFNLVYGKWWSTFGLIMVLSLIVSVLSYIPIIPLYIVGIVTALHNVESKTSPTAAFEGMQMVVSIIVPVFYLIYLLLGALPNIGIAFQYFNLVERKESRGLMSQIENFGQPQDPTITNPHDEQY